MAQSISVPERTIASNIIADGATDDSAALTAAIAAAQSANVPLILPPGRINIATPIVVMVTTGVLEIASEGQTELYLNSGSPVCLNFSAPVALTTTLSAPVVFGDQAINLTSVAGLLVGQLVALTTNTSVDSGFSYKKVMVGIVTKIVGTRVHLAEPCNFDFTTAETAVNVCTKASLRMRGVDVACAADKRIDFTRLQDCLIERMTLTGTGQTTNDDIIQLYATHGVTFRDIRAFNSRYSINVNVGSRNTLVDGLYAENVRHPVDANTWSYNTMVRDAIGVNTQGLIECHPCFEMHFEDCIDRPTDTPTGGIRIRSIGGSVRRCKVHATDEVAVSDVQGPLLLAAYQYIGQLYDRLYEDIESSTAILTASDVRKLIVRRCKVPTITVDGTGTRVTSVEIDDQTVVTNGARMDLRRVNLLSLRQPLMLTAYSEWGFRGTIATITGITQANPSVVTATAHGFSNGALVRIDGVVGMTQVNETVFTIANVAANTFELSGIDSSAYTAYTAGGKAALGIMMQTVDPVRIPGVGWYPKLHYQAIIRDNTAALGATSITIPVKLKHNWGISERQRRWMELTVRAFSSTDGSVVAKYQASSYQGSTSGSSLGAVQSMAGTISTLTAVINNSAHHFSTQVTAEGGDQAVDMDQYYFTFDIVVTCNNVADEVEYVELEVEERRPQL